MQPGACRRSRSRRGLMARARSSAGRRPGRRGRAVRGAPHGVGRSGPAGPLAHRIGDQPPAVKAVHRLPVERLPRAHARNRITPADSQIQESQYGLIDPVVHSVPAHRSRVTHCRAVRAVHEPPRPSRQRANDAAAAATSTPAHSSSRLGSPPLPLTAGGPWQGGKTLALRASAWSHLTQAQVREWLRRSGCLRLADHHLELHVGPPQDLVARQGPPNRWLPARDARK